MPERAPGKLRVLADASSMSIGEVRRYHRAGCLLLEIDREESTERELRRLRRVRRLRRDLGLAPDAIAIIVRLVDRLEEIQSRR